MVSRGESGGVFWMEENMDEKILKERERYEAFEKKRFAEETIEEENKQSIQSGTILIHKIPVEFSKRKILQEKAAIWMPSDFEELTEEEISAIYLLGNKPQIVWGNTYLNFSLGFHYTEHKVPNEFMGDFAKIAKMMLEKTGPKVTIYGIKNRKSGKHNISYLEFVSHTLDAAIYDIMFFSSLEERVLIGFMNFGYKYNKRYRTIALEMLETFRFLEDEEGEKEK